jgi:hypothetical protein
MGNQSSVEQEPGAQQRGRLGLTAQGLPGLGGRLRNKSVIEVNLTQEVASSPESIGVGNKRGGSNEALHL